MAPLRDSRTKHKGHRRQLAREVRACRRAFAGKIRTLRTVGKTLFGGRTSKGACGNPSLTAVRGAFICVRIGVQRSPST